MRAVLSEAFVANHGFSAWRFAAVIAGLSLAVGLWFATVMNGFSHDPLTVAAAAASAGATTFLMCLVVASPVWWLLVRLGFRGWAASLLAGGGCYLVMMMAPFVLITLITLVGGARPPVVQDLGQLVLTAICGLPLGLTFGWLVWRMAFRPDPSTTTTSSPTPQA